MRKKFIYLLLGFIISLNIPVVNGDVTSLLLVPDNLIGTYYEGMNEFLLISIDLEITYIEDLVRWEFEFEYDEELLELWDGELGTTIYSETGGWSGNIHEGMLSTSFSGSGLLWTYYLKPKSLGTSIFKINSKLYDTSDNLIPHETPSCIVNVLSFENWLEDEKQTTTERIEELTQAFESLDKDYQSLLSSYDSLENVNEGLESQLDEIQSDIDTLEEDYEDLTKDFELVTVQIDQLQEQIEELKNRGIPGFPVTSIIIGLLMVIINRIASKEKTGKTPLIRGAIILIILSLSLGYPVSGDLNSDLISWWPADGDVLDIAGDNHGTPYNPMTYDPSKVGLAFSFTGEGNYIDLPAHKFETLNGLTIEGWVKHNSIRQVIQRYLSLYNSKGEFAVLRLDFEGLHFYLLREGKLDFDHIRANNVLEVGKWHHVAGTFDGDYMRLYADGKEVEKRKVVGQLYLGSNRRAIFSSDAEPMDGLLDEFTLYARALTISEINDIYKAGLNGESGRPTLYLEPSSIYGTQYEGENEVLLLKTDLMISNIADLVKWEFEFEYDEELLELWDGELGATIYSETGGWSGNIHEGMLSSSFSGSGLLWTYYLRPKSLGTSTFKINSKLIDSSENLIHHKMAEGIITTFPPEEFVGKEQAELNIELEALEESYELLIKEHLQLTSLHNSLQAMNEDLESQLEKIQSDYSDLEEEFVGLSEEYESLNTQVKQLQDQIQELKNQGIPGYPIESILAGLIITAIVVWFVQRKSVTT